MEIKKALSQNEKIIQEYEKKFNMQEVRKNIYAKVITNAFVKNFLKESKLPEQVVSDNLGLFLDLANENEPCLKCKSLKSCPKNIKGQLARVTRLSAQNFCMEYCACKYKKEYAKQEEYYIYHDFDDEFMTSSIEDVTLNNYRKGIIRGISDVLEGKTKSLYLCGKMGLGKTYLYTVLCNEYINNNKEKVCFVNTRKIVEQLRGLVFNKENEAYEKIKKDLMNCSLLVLDDFGNEKITEWSKEDVLFDILDARFSKGLITLFASDFTLEELPELYGKDLKTKRLINLIVNYTKEIELEGISVK